MNVRRLVTGALWIAACCCAVYAQDINPPSIHSDRGAWPIRRQWTVEETRHFGTWIQHIYQMKRYGSREQQLARLERVLTDRNMNLLLRPEFAGEGCNPQLDIETIRAMHRVVDCAKLTVSLGSYYAYRRALPWMFSSVRSGNGEDIRTAPCTIPASDVSSFDYSSPGAFMRDAITTTCTGNFRVELDGDNAGLSDTVPVRIARDSLIPGSMYYLDGHVLILAVVEDDGELRFLDATTSPSRDIYTFNGFYALSGLTPRQSNVPGNEYAGCYRGFRITRWPIADTGATGKVTRVRRRTNEEMQAFGFSTEQYDRLEELLARGGINDNGIEIKSYRQFIQARLRTPHTFDLVSDIEAFASATVAQLGQREQRVQAAWSDVNRHGPIAFPDDVPGENIYTASGRWGEHASALEDATLRASYFELLDHIDTAIEWYTIRPEDANLDRLGKYAIWSHADLAGAVIMAKNRIFQSTTFEFRDSQGKVVRLSLLDFEHRLYDMSFDPNHPPELRWGAPMGSRETQALPDKPTPIPSGAMIAMADAYARQGYYRSLARWEPEPSYLRDMTASSFTTAAKFDERLRMKWFDGPSPPLIPRDRKLAMSDSSALPKLTRRSSR